MQYDRQIHISIGANRWSKQWNPQTLLWSDFVEKLRMPVRSSETLAEYLSMPKSRQDELKDIGGYVAGALSGVQRKPEAVLGRDVVTLDLDAIPAGQTDAILKRIEGLSCCPWTEPLRRMSMNRWQEKPPNILESSTVTPQPFRLRD